MSLSYKRKRFYREYLRCGNGTTAAILAGYSERSAHARASEMLKDPEGLEYYMGIMDDLNERIMCDAEDVKNEFAKLGLSDIRGIVSEDGERLVPIHKLDDFTAASIAAVEVVTRKDKDGQVIDYVHKYKFHSNVQALMDLARQFNLHEKDREACAGTVNVYLDDKDSKA